MINSTTARILAMVAMAGLLTGPAFAQKERKTLLPDAQKTKEPEQRRRPTQKKGPSLGGERFVRKGKVKAQADAKWNEAFNLLKKLIESTPDANPEKPELYYRLSEMFWERASATEIRAFDEEEQCLSRGGGDAAAQRCESVRKNKQVEAQKYRDQAIKVYKHIVRNFPSYPRLDNVLFALAFNFLRKGDAEGAKKIFIELIRRYPKSRRMADTLLNLGEIYFEDGQVQQASKFYGKVAKNYRDASVYGYALYKLGWCYFNMSKFTDALRQFLAVIEHTNRLEGRGGSKNRLTLKREALKDLVRTYVNIEAANPTKAIAFFRKVAPDDYLDLSERLAVLYSDTGQFQNSNKLFRELIRLQPKSYKVVGFQRWISLNTRNIGKDPVEAVRELKRLVSLWSAVKDAKDAEPERVAKDRSGIEEQLRAMAVQYHRQATITDNPNDYALAFELYSDYVKTFPDSANAYDMTFFFGELLYKQKKWKPAARAYEKVLEIKGDGPYTKDAAHGAVLAYKKLLQPRQKSAPKQAAAAPGEEKKKDPPAKKEIPEDYQRYLKAIDRYVKYVKDGQYLVDIKYSQALIYYEFEHLDTALPVFQDICDNHPTHRLATFSCNFVLDIHNWRNDQGALTAQANKCVNSGPASRDPELRKLCSDIVKTSAFRKCQGVEGKRQYVKSARCYLKFARNFPNSEIKDKAYYNAALNFEREKRIESAIQARLALVNNVSGSPLVHKALYQIAGNLQALAIFSKASEAYEFYAEKFSDREEAKEALRLAAIFRDGLGQLEQAEKNARNYLKAIGAKDKAKSAEIFFSLGKIYEKQENWDRTVRHYQEFLGKYQGSATPDLLLRAYVRMGNAYAKKPRGGAKKSQAAYKAAFEMYQKLSTDQVNSLTTGRAAVAEARFQMGEEVFRRLKRTPLKVRNSRNLKKFTESMKNKIAEKSKIAAEARTVFLEVIKFGAPNWAIAALARIGQIFEELSNEIYNIPAPKGFDEEQVEAFKTRMAEYAEVPRTKAKEAFELCLAKARELKWFNKWSDLAERRLAELMPGKYRYNAEVRAQPTFFGPDIVGQRFIAKMDEGDSEEEGQ